MRGVIKGRLDFFRKFICFGEAIVLKGEMQYSLIPSFQFSQQLQGVPKKSTINNNNNDNNGYKN